MQMTSWNGADDNNVKAAGRTAAGVATRLNDGNNWWWRTTNNNNNNNNNNNHITKTKKFMLKEELWLNDLQGDAYRIRRRRRNDATDFFGFTCFVRSHFSFALRHTHLL
jgi:hypothetical protein